MPDSATYFNFLGHLSSFKVPKTRVRKQALHYRRFLFDGATLLSTLLELHFLHLHWPEFFTIIFEGNYGGREAATGANCKRECGGKCGDSSLPLFFRPHPSAASCSVRL